MPGGYLPDDVGERALQMLGIQDAYLEPVTTKDGEIRAWAVFVMVDSTPGGRCTCGHVTANHMVLPMRLTKELAIGSLHDTIRALVAAMTATYPQLRDEIPDGVVQPEEGDWLRALQRVRTEWDGKIRAKRRQAIENDLPPRPVSRTRKKRPGVEEPDAVREWRASAKAARSAAGLTQAQLGERVGLGQAQISQIERAATSLNLDHAVAISGELGIDAPAMAD